MCDDFEDEFGREVGERIHGWLGIGGKEAKKRRSVMQKEIVTRGLHLGFPSLLPGYFRMPAGARYKTDRPCSS